jgi:hypothetical protein
MTRPARAPFPTGDGARAVSTTVHDAVTAVTMEEGAAVDLAP